VRRTRPLVLLTVLALLASLGAVAPPVVRAATVGFTILHTNDFHGQLEASGSNPGMARVATIVNDVRTAVGAGNVLLVDAGDEMQGSLLSNLQHGAPTIATYNAMGYAVATFGNHEFDWGQANLADRTTQATYPYVTANIVKNDTGNCATAGWTKPDFADSPYDVQTVNGVKVAFIGTHGVGKTTLCYELAAALKKRDVTVELVREMARECPLPINRETTLPAQAWILHSQIAWELAAASRAQVVVCDRAALDNYCYLKRAGDGSAWEQALCELARGWTPTYDVLVKVPIVHRPTFDGVRDTDIAFQHEIEDLITQTLAAWCVPHVALEADARERWAATVLDAILPVLRPQELLFPEANGGASA